MANIFQKNLVSRILFVNQDLLLLNTGHLLGWAKHHLGLRDCPGLDRVLPYDMLQSQPLVSVTVIIFGNRVFADEIKLQ